MAFELIYTSARKGLKPGSMGFCTVAMSREMPPATAMALEALSGYRHLFAAGDPRCAENPINFCHYLLPDRGRVLRVLAQIGPAPADYSGRINKLAQFLVLELDECPSAGPAWLLQNSTLFSGVWNGEPRWIDQMPLVPTGTVPPGPCTTWKKIMGDAGWAGELLARYFNRPQAPVHLLCDPTTPLLALLAEALALLPPPVRWQIGFSTYFTAQPGPGVQCQWRGLVAGSPAAGTVDPVTCIDLTRPRGRAPDGPYYAAARAGVAIDIEIAGASSGRPQDTGAAVLAVGRMGRPAPTVVHGIGAERSVYALAATKPIHTRTRFFHSRDLNAPENGQPSRGGRWLLRLLTFGAAAALLLFVAAAGWYFTSRGAGLLSQAQRVLEHHRSMAAATAKHLKKPVRDRQPMAVVKTNASKSAVANALEAKPPKNNTRANGKAPASRGGTKAEKPNSNTAGKGGIAAKRRAQIPAATLAAEKISSAFAQLRDKRMHIESLRVKVLPKDHFFPHQANAGSLSTTLPSLRPYSVHGVQWFAVTFPHNSHLLAANAAGKKLLPGQWYPVTKGNLLLEWESGPNQAGLSSLSATERNVKFATIRVVANGTLTLNCLGQYSKADSARQTAARQLVLDIQLRDGTLERVQFMRSRDSKIITLGSTVSDVTPLELEYSLASAQLYLTFEQVARGWQARRATAKHMRQVVASPNRKMITSGELNNQANAINKLLHLPKGRSLRPPQLHSLQFIFVIRGGTLRNNCAEALRNLNTLEQMWIYGLAAVKSNLDNWDKDYNSLASSLKKMRSKSPRAKLLQKQMTSLNNQMAQARKLEAFGRQMLQNIHLLKQFSITLRVELYRSGPVLERITYAVERGARK